MSRSKKHTGFTLLEILIVIGILAIILSILIPNFYKSKAKGAYSACQSNLRSISTAIGVYANDNGGLSPSALSSLRPNYLKALPTCPAAQADTYTPGYSGWTSSMTNGTATVCPFTIYCSGSYHTAAGAATNYPQYISGVGLR